MITILPKDNINVSWPNLPVFFLAGPVQGGSDWQHTMCQLLHQETAKPGARIQEFFVAIPCRYPAGHPLREYQSEGSAKEGVFARQLDWERHYLRIAAERGKIIFWLPCESRTEPRKDGNPYARDTYGELGEWRGRLIHEPKYRKRVLIGAEEGFPGLDVIQRNFRQAFLYDFPFYLTMEEVVEKAMLR